MSEPRAYHHFLGNGIDAVLLGPSGAMSAEAAQGLDRCYWYKSDLYYADSRQFLPGQDPLAFMAAPPGGTNFQLAPLARAWYEVLDAGGEPIPLTQSRQRFEPGTGMLHTTAGFGNHHVELRTWLAPNLPALHFDLRASADLTIRAWLAPGLWPEDSEQTDPLTALDAGAAWDDGWVATIGADSCAGSLAAPGAGFTGTGRRGPDLWAIMRGTRLQWWAVLESTRYAREHNARHRLPTAPAPDAAVAAPSIDIPDPEFNRLHAFSMYMFQAMQNPYSGGIPVNNLRRTFNSHVFWDGAFVQRALLEAGRVQPAREAWRFLARTREAAAANARATFDAPGLHWDWETTHEGRRAYLPWMQQRFQVHNTPLLAHMILADYRATRDRAVLAEGYDLLTGAAEFLLAAVLTDEGPYLVTRPLVGSHEEAHRVVNDGATVAASLRLLRDVSLAARALRKDDAMARRCAEAAHRLRPTLSALYNGRYFQASRDEVRLNTSSLAPIYPSDVVAPGDPRALATIAAYQQRYAGRLAGHGNSEEGFPWTAGLLARILAYQGQAAGAWEQLNFVRPALCAQGGCCEYLNEAGHWNNQFFSTAQAALCSALHAQLAQQHGNEVRLFPALPAGWDRAAFHGFLIAGLRLSAEYRGGAARVTVRNETDRERRVWLRLGESARQQCLPAGAEQTIELGKNVAYRSA